MRLLFDHNVPAPLRRLLTGYDISLAGELGWQRLTNGELLAAAEQAGFDVLLTADQNLRYQQNLSGRRIGIVILSTQTIGVLRENLPAVAAAIDGAGQGDYVELTLPRQQLQRRAPPAHRQ